MTKKKLIPFAWLPGAWGLAGKTREIAKAEYELEGYDLEQRLIDIAKDDITEDEYARKCLSLQKKYGHMDEEAYQSRLIALIKDASQQERARLEFDYKFGRIDENAYHKQNANLNKEPWVTVVNMNFNSASSLEGSFELDWNEYFVEKLIADGYLGSSPDAMVNQWFTEVCKHVALEEFDGTGNFTADAEANLETMRRWHSAEKMADQRTGHK